MDDTEVDQKILSAFRRLYNLERLRTLGASGWVVTDAEEKVARSRADLGDDAWKQVEENYPRFKEKAEQRDRLLEAFDERCKSCAHWNAGYFSSEEENPRWCEKYTRLTISAPEPCKDHRLKVIS